MSSKWHIILDREEQRRKVAFLEGRAQGTGCAGDPEEVEFSLALYSDQISLNVPASTLGREFVADLTAILGLPKLPPTVKCSCSWGQGVVGAMLLVLWELPAPNAARLLRTLHAFLGSSLPS
ncbi:MAG: hypothetical protein WCF59_01365 [Desulfobaccales bacterium]|jgi:hypothetical protein